MNQIHVDIIDARPNCDALYISVFVAQDWSNMNDDDLCECILSFEEDHVMQHYTCSFNEAYEVYISDAYPYCTATCKDFHYSVSWYEIIQKVCCMMKYDEI